MEDFDSNKEVLSRAIRAGKRTYFMDVKETRHGEMYLTITESKRRLNPRTGQAFYEKHKVFLYKEDFEKFSEGLQGVIRFIQTGEIPPEPEREYISTSEFTDVDFDNLEPQN
jgi:hypothetical protein